MIGSSTPTIRLNGPLLYLARIAWVVIFLYSFGKVILGASLYINELNIVCTASQEVCSQRVGPNKTEAAELLEAVAEALQPEHASLWIRPMSDDRRRSNDAG